MLSCRHVLCVFGTLPLLAMFGCASVMSPGPDKVLFKSDPNGASVSVDGTPVGRTPVTADVSRTAKYATFSLVGYEDEQLPISRKANPWVAGNAVVGGVAGAMADSSNNDAEMANPEMDAHLHRSLHAASVRPTSSP